MNQKFFVLEGCEAVGKTTQLKRLEQILKEKGYSVVVTREPGGTVVGEKIRSVVLDPAHADTIQPIASLMLFNAARHQWMHEVVTPALARGQIVLSDRSFLTTMVYQGYIEGIDLEFVKSLCMKAVNGVLPDKIFLLDISSEEMEHRLRASGNAAEKTTRYDVKGADFHRKAREGYLAQINEFPGLIERIDGEMPVEAITETLLTKILATLV
jgi:dTMP kinase